MSNPFTLIELRQFVQALSAERSQLFDRLDRTKSSEEQADVLADIEKNQFLDNKVYDVMKVMIKVT